MLYITKGKQPSQLTSTVSPSRLFTMILLAPFFDAIAAWRIIDFICLIIPSLIAGVDQCFAL